MLTSSYGGFGAAAAQGIAMAEAEEKQEMEKSRSGGGGDAIGVDGLVGGVSNSCHALERSGSSCSAGHCDAEMSGSPPFNGDSGLASRTKGSGHSTPISGVLLPSTHFVRNAVHSDGEGSTSYAINTSTRNSGGSVKKSFGRKE